MPAPRTPRIDSLAQRAKSDLIFIKAAAHRAGVFFQFTHREFQPAIDV
jgi:hypothetical protein